MSDDTLPDTDDPYVLLGATPEDDDLAIRRAYARRIRVFRPDRSPHEFQRVHAAFEQITATRKITRFHQAHQDAPAPTPEPPSTPTAPAAASPAAASPAVLARRVATDLAEASTASPIRRGAILEALLAERVPLEILMRDDAHRTMILRHPTLTWARLARDGHDLPAVAAVWEMAFDDAREHDPERAHALLDDPRMHLDAADAPGFSRQVLQRVAALSWTHPFDAAALLARMRVAFPLHAALDQVFDAIALEVAATTALRGHALPSVVVHLRELVLASHLGMTKSVQTRRVTALIESIRANPEQRLAELATLRLAADLAPLHEMLYHLLPDDRVVLGALPDARYTELSEAITAGGLGDSSLKVAGGAVGGGAFIVSRLFQTLGWIAVVLVAITLVTVGVIYVAFRRYARIRVRIAVAVATVPVASRVVVQWIEHNGPAHAGVLTNHRARIEQDEDLLLFSMLAATAGAFGELAP